MRVLVCVKRVPAPGAKINVTDDGRAIDTTHLAFTTSPHEECALEAAVQLVEQHGGTAHVLTVGAAEAEEQLRYAASVGATDGALVTLEGDIDPQRTARALTAAIGELEAAAGAFDLILFGNESADAGGFQVGVRVARTLGRPIVNGAKTLELHIRGGSPTDAPDALRVERESDAGREIYSLPLPACVGVKEGINLPRYPTMRGRLASKKAAITTIDAPGEDAAGGNEGLPMSSLERPPETANETVVLGEGAGAAGAVVDVLDELGVLP